MTDELALAVAECLRAFSRLAQVAGEAGSVVAELDARAAQVDAADEPDEVDPADAPLVGADRDAAILRVLRGASGGAASVEIAKQTGLTQDAVKQSLVRMRGRKLVVLKGTRRAARWYASDDDPQVVWSGSKERAGGPRLSELSSGSLER